MAVDVRPLTCLLACIISSIRFDNKKAAARLFTVSRANTGSMNIAERAMSRIAIAAS